MVYLLYLAAFLILLVSLAHSVLGERYILIRLFRRGDVPKIRGSVELTKLTLRFAWHLTSLVWLGMAAILLNIAHPPVTTASLGLITGCCFFLQFLTAVIASRGRHFSWIFFLAIGLLILFATQN